MFVGAALLRAVEVEVAPFSTESPVKDMIYVLRVAYQECLACFEDVLVIAIADACAMSERRDVILRSSSMMTTSR